jgi:hypothetical protein
MVAWINKTFQKVISRWGESRKCCDAGVNANEQRLRERQYKGRDDNDIDRNARQTNKCRLADSKYTLLASEAGPNNADRDMTVEIRFSSRYVVMVVLVEA